MTTEEEAMTIGEIMIKEGEGMKEVGMRREVDMQEEEGMKAGGDEDMVLEAGTKGRLWV